MGQLTIYTSADGSAPTCTGQTGSLSALLQACLVDGYGAKAAAGWSLAYSGTSKIALRQGAGNRYYVRIQDDGPGAGTFKEARVTGYESMTGIDTGENPVPTAALGVGGIAMVVCRKSTSLDATARTWVVAADAQTCYVFINSEAVGNYFACWFGDFYSLMRNDPNRFFVCGRMSENSSSATAERCASLQSAFTGGSFFVNRSHNNPIGAFNSGLHSDYVKHQTGAFAGVVPYTNPEDTKFYASRVWVHDSVTIPVNSLRGRLRGIWVPCHAITNFADRDTVGGAGLLAGKTWLLIKNVLNSGGTQGVVAVETSSTVETN